MSFSVALPLSVAGVVMTMLRMSYPFGYRYVSKKLACFAGLVLTIAGYYALVHHASTDAAKAFLLACLAALEISGFYSVGLNAVNKSKSDSSSESYPVPPPEGSPKGLGPSGQA